MALEEEVARHYTHGALEAAILAGLEAMGLPADGIRREDLSAVDEFHIGGPQATGDLAEQLDLRPGLRLLDIGCGIGGAARLFAGRHGCRVTGLDLTPEYVAVAAALTMRAGLAEQVAFQVGSALSLPFPDASFDRATVLHVGMNIPDKDRLCAEIARVLIPGGVLGLYDVMRTGPGDIDFPVPWAASPATSFLAEPATYRRALSGAGLEIAAERPRRDLALAFFQRMRERMAAGGPPPLGLHILMGPAAPQKVANMIAAVEQGRVAPVELICRRR